MHAARHGWDVEKDAPLFRNWAIHTGIETLFLQDRFSLGFPFKSIFSFFHVFVFTNTESELKFPDMWEVKCFFQGLQ